MIAARVADGLACHGFLLVNDWPGGMRPSGSRSLRRSYASLPAATAEHEDDHRNASHAQSHAEHQERRPSLFDAAGEHVEVLAIDSGHETWAPAAWGDLGDLLREQGDAAGARAAYQQAIDSGHEDWAPIAVTRLREMLKHRRAWLGSDPGMAR
jgi:hypothetical protein